MTEYEGDDCSVVVSEDRLEWRSPPPVRHAKRKASPAREWTESKVVLARDIAAFLAHFRQYRYYNKRELPRTAAYVLQGHFYVEQEDRFTWPFFAMESVADVLTLFQCFKRMQERPDCHPIFMMECVTETQPRKWVLDLDGEIAKLHRAGFAASPTVCSDEEVRCFESAAVQYAMLLLRALRELGFLRSQHVVIGINTRHRYYHIPAEGAAPPRRLCIKLSIHVTLDIIALHREWITAMRQAYACIDNPAFAAKVLPAESAAQVLGVRDMDDSAIINNSVGQNMSTLFSSKQYGEPMFKFLHAFIVDVAAMDVESVAGLHFLQNNVGAYVLTSMILESPFSRRLRVPSSTLPLLPLRQPSPPGGAVSTSVVTPHTGRQDIPDFAQRLLFAGVPGPPQLNTTMPTLYDRLPAAIPAQHQDPSLRGTVVRNVKVNKNVRCVWYLKKDPPVHRQHKSNGCIVCVYTPPDAPAPRVFVMCYGCMLDTRGTLTRSPLWPWIEVVGSDVSVLQYVLRGDVK